MSANKQKQKESPKQEESGQAVTGATPVVAAEELDPGRERRPLESYFQEIGGTRTLKREEEVFLAKDLESATAELPESARTALVSGEWDSLNQL